MTDVQWGVLTTLPNGTTEIEPRCARSDARHTALARDAEFPDDPPARIVWRELGNWQPGPDGHLFGVAYSWPNGHIEIEAKTSRAEADSFIRIRNSQCDDGATASLASRTAGEWWLADASKERAW